MSWRIEKGYMPGIYNVFDDENNPVAVDCTEDRARLIAAALDLLEALEEMVEKFSHYVFKPIPPIQPGCQADDEWIAVQHTLTAIAKATGGES